MDTFSDIVDTLRVANERIENGEWYMCTVTSRTLYRTCEDFRENLYKEIDFEKFFGVMEYHEKCVKIHMHGYVCLNPSLYEIKTQDENIVIDLDKYNIVLHGRVLDKTESEKKRWNSYCRKQIEHTYEYNDFVKKGLWYRFHKFGKRTKDVWSYELSETRPAHDTPTCSKRPPLSTGGGTSPR